MERDSKPVQSLERGLMALELAVGGEGRPARIAKVLGVDRSTAYRLLYTLMVQGYLDQDARTREFVPNPNKFFSLSSAVAGAMNWPAVASGFLKQLSERTGETANLAVRQGHEIVYVAQQQTQEAVVVNHGLGMRRPVHSSALGKAILAFLPEADVDRLIQEYGLPAKTHRTITDPQILKLHLKSVREHGYSIDDEETLIGVRCLAAPIYDHSNQIVASIGISGPSTRVTLESVPGLGRTVFEVAGRISDALGYRQPVPAGDNALPQHLKPT